MKIASKIFSVFLSLVMLFGISSAIPVSAEAASLPKTTISTITSYPCAFTVYVNKQKNVTGYQIQYATSSNFKGSKSVNTTGTSSAIKNRASATKYYVRVRTYKKSGKKYTYSAWSASKTVTTLHKNASDPAHIKSITAAPCAFTVTTYASKNAQKFQARYSTNKNFSGAKTTTSNSGTIKVTGRAGNTTYYVQTRTYRTVKGKTYYSNWSPAKTVKTKPKQVTTTKPATTKPTTTKPATVTSTNSNVKDVFNLVNNERVKNGVSKLTYRNDLQSAADTRAKELVTKFDHTRPNGTDWYTVIPASVSIKTGGENIAYGKKDANAVMDSWMNSAGHKANILKKEFTGIAVGCYEKDGVKYWVQLFVG
ncbi:MAG: CAP domain-containing protein [Eubacterium sp.]|nr:CAP domain-containing protein [Eubacterium sp.]